MGWTRFLARNGFFFLACGFRGASRASGPAPWLVRMMAMGQGVGPRTLSEVTSADGDPAWARSGRGGLGACFVLRLLLFLACRRHVLPSRHSRWQTSSVARFTRSNWASRVSSRDRRRWTSRSTSQLSRTLGARLRPSSWLEEEVEARELSEVALGVGTSSERESWLEERDGRGSIPSKRTLWRNCRGGEKGPMWVRENLRAQSCLDKVVGSHLWQLC